MQGVEMGDAIYLYCLARTGRIPVISGTGIDGKHPLFLQNVEDITAVLSMVFLDEFQGPPAEQGMQDMSWLGQRVWRHEEVIEQVMRHSPVLPVPFATMFHSWTSLEKSLKCHLDTVSEFLVHVTDADEWAVKALMDPVKAKREYRLEILRKEEKYLKSLSPGTHYLHTRRILDEKEKSLCNHLKEICKEMAVELNNHSWKFSERRVLSEDVTGKDKRMLLNWAFLVPRLNRDDFLARIRRANEEYAGLGLLFELSGPWPPYSFAPSLKNKSDK
jgi:hypothetical protein